MNGPSHFRIAEELLEAVRTGDKPMSSEAYANAIATAGAHATLALVAATVDARYEITDSDDWAEVVT